MIPLLLGGVGGGYSPLEGGRGVFFQYRLRKPQNMLIIIFPRALKQGVQRRWTEPKDLIFVPFDGGKVLLECLVYIKMLGNTPLAPLKGGMDTPLAPLKGGFC